MEGIWVAVLNISAAVAAKIAAKHDISTHEVREAVTCVQGLAFRWDVDEIRGRRAVITAEIRHFQVAVVVYPIGDDEWNLGSVYPV